MTTPSTVKWRLKQLASDRLIDIAMCDNMVGRNSTATVCLKSNKSSRKHATFVVNMEGNLLVQDLKSANGTFVNGTQVSVFFFHRVFPGDIVSFGMADINVVEEDRDKLCFFKVLKVEQPEINREVSEAGAVAADSTTETHENVSVSSLNNQSNNNASDANVVGPDSVGVIEISSSTSDNEADIAEIKITNNVPSVGLSAKKATKSNLHSAFKMPKQPKVQSLHCSLSNIKKTTDVPPANILSRRRTIRVESNESGASSTSTVVSPLTTQFSDSIKKTTDVPLASVSSRRRTVQVEANESRAPTSTIVRPHQESMSIKETTNVPPANMSSRKRTIQVEGNETRAPTSTVVRPHQESMTTQFSDSVKETLNVPPANISSRRRTIQVEANDSRAPTATVVRPHQVSMTTQYSDSVKETMNVPPANISSRRRTIQVEANESLAPTSTVVRPQQSMTTKFGSRRRSMCSESTSRPNNLGKITKKTMSDADFGELSLINILSPTNNEKIDSRSTKKRHSEGSNKKGKKQHNTRAATKNNHENEKAITDCGSKQATGKKKTDQICSNSKTTTVNQTPILGATKETDMHDKELKPKPLEEKRDLNSKAVESLLNALEANSTSNKDNNYSEEKSDLNNKPVENLLNALDTNITPNKDNSAEKRNLNNKPVENLPNMLDTNVTTNKDNSVIIDITEDDDDMDFSCSQIFHMSQMFKTEPPDDTYQKIKNELAEMDFCNEEVILNPVPINLESDFDMSGFENTQEICEFLEDGIEVGNKDAPIITSNQSRDSAEVNQIEGEIASEHDDIVLIIQSSDDTPNKIEAAKRRSSCSGKRRPSIPPIIEPHTITKPEKKLRQSPRKKAADAHKGAPKQKRKSSLEAPIEKKKIKNNPKSPTNPLKYESKEIALQFKKRRSSSVDIDKAEKVSIREERRKKLKELASASKSGDNVLEHNNTNLIDSIINAGNIANARISSEFHLRTDPVVNKDAKTVEYGKLKPLDLPPRTCGYNLRRAKSSDDIQVQRPNGVLNTHQSRPITRHSTCTDIRVPPPTAAPNVYDFRSRVIPTTRNDPRAFPSANEPPYSKGPYPFNVYQEDYISNKLIWNNGAQARRPPPVRRLINVDDIPKKVVQWSPDWLLEQGSSDSRIPINSPPATEIPLHFRDFTHYYNTFSKLVLLENWQYLFKGFQEDIEKPRRVKIEHMRVTNDLMTLDCVCYISRQELRQGAFYKPEDVIIFECPVMKVSNKAALNFGIIQNSRKSLIPNEGLISVRLGDLCPGDPHTKLEFTVLTRYQPTKELDIRRTPIVKVLSNIRAHLMLIRAVKGIEQSPLCSMILNPKMSDYKFTITHRDMIHPHDLSDQQKAIVLEAASLCTGDKHGIYCVKGPPGTGKSTVIVNLIFQILFSHRHSRNPGKPPLILLAAPSNTAVDSLISKLVMIKYNLALAFRHQIKLVRIGPLSSINKEVMCYSLPKLAETHVPIKNIDIPQIKAVRDRNEKRAVEYAKTFFGDQYGHELKMCENLVIEKSNIICTTLNSCINGRLIDAVNRGLIEFTCCIIDEATQCHEVEALLPTILGINKLVLVGDPQQLNATIMSRDALKLGFGQSLFTRLANNFGTDPRSPIRMLTDQYRMHPQICSFPNKQFYEGKLRSFPRPVNKLPDEIRPYLVFNCAKVTPSKDYTNMDEIYLIKTLLSTIFSMVNRDYKYTVGIITPYNAQKDLICSNIADLVVQNENCKITTNTVDSFQGSEFDIVIISCVRDSSNSFLQNENRLNVALTRAKQALYIIGNYTLFKECRPLYDLREDAKKRKVLLDIKQNPKFMPNLNRYLIRRNSSVSDQSL